MNFENWVKQAGFLEKLKKWSAMVGKDELADAGLNESDLEDAEQDVAETLIVDGRNLATEDDVRRFFKKCLRNRLRDMGRKLRREGPKEPSEAAEGASAPGNFVEDSMNREEAQLIRAAMEQLPARDVTALQLVYLEGDSYEEAARKLGTSPGTLGSWLNRAKKDIRRILDA